MEKKHADLSKRIEEVFYELVAVRSDTNTLFERDIEEYIYNWLGNIKYFHNNREQFGMFNIEGDYLKRSIVWALIKGKGDKTIVLLHHHDSVDTFDFGVLQQVAFSPKELECQLRKMNFNEEVKWDLSSEQWIFGRGTSDMKAGAAIQLSIIEEYSKNETFQGNILLLSVPDEESLSAGMRGSISLLKKLKNKFKLSYTLCINSEPHQRKLQNVGVFHEGSVGKLMPLVYIRGIKTHAADIFQGFNPLVLQAEILKRIELNEDLTDLVDDEISPPPSWINFRDRKEMYDVSTPVSSGGYFTLLTLKRTPKEALQQIKEICIDAFEQVIKNMNDHYSSYLKKSNKESKVLNWKTNVKTFEEIYNEALKYGGEKFLKDYENTIEKLKKDIQSNKISMQESNFVLIEKVLDYTRDLNPLVVIAFSPPYYPYITNKDISILDDKVFSLGQRINSITKKEWNEEYKKQNYFMGISDMSYLAICKIEDIVPYIEPNMPLWPKVYCIPFQDMEDISMAVINIGPWGKDLHKVTERVNKKDLFERTPRIIEHVIEYILT